MGDVVLERNICFVDTPGSRSRDTGQLDAVIQYMNQQLFRATAAADCSNADFQNMMAGNGGSQVDAILYFISHGMSSTYNRYERANRVRYTFL
jgi:hypothetical protein